jgi:dolichol-phosphate mannosyltransferase
MPSAAAPVLSVVTPAYNEADNLPLLYERLRQALPNIDWEWIVVDDHSRDATFDRLAEIARSDHRVSAIRLARNSGSHTALTCGIDHAAGACVAIMAADLQDPPEVLPVLVDKWRAGAQVVWATRATRPGERMATIGFARLYYFMMRRIVGMEDIPASGADFFLLDRRVVDAYGRFHETNVSFFSLVTWMGFRQTSITYSKEPRLHGRSGWSMKKKVKLVVDSVTSFTYLPIRVMSWLGCLIALLGFLYAGYIIANALLGRPVEGWSSIMVAVLVMSGMQFVMMGVLGEYLWRALDESRRRPRYLVEAVTGRLDEGPVRG